MKPCTMAVVTFMVAAVIGPARAQPAGADQSSTVDQYAKFERGETRFDCRVGCSFSWGYNRRTLKALYTSESWRPLAEKLLAIGHQGDASYFLLARAAEGLGLRDQARIYYEFARAERAAGNRCGDAKADRCVSLDIDAELQARLARRPPAIAAEEPQAPAPTPQAQSSDIVAAVTDPLAGAQTVTPAQPTATEQTSAPPGRPPSYPSKNVRLIAGPVRSASDVLARKIAPQLRDKVGRAVIVDNRYTLSAAPSVDPEGTVLLVLPALSLEQFENLASLGRGVYASRAIRDDVGRFLSSEIAAMDLPPPDSIAAPIAARGVSYRPVVDMKGVDTALYETDLLDCQRYALQVVGPGTAAAAGAALGYGIGYLVGRAYGVENRSSIGRTTAITGAVSGAAGGVVSEQAVVNRCIAGRGYRVLN